MPSDDQILVTCTHGECPIRKRVPLLDLETFILIHPGHEIPSYDQAQAEKPTVPCPTCQTAGRDGTLVYLEDHLRKSPPDRETPVPALLEGVDFDGLWKRAEVLGSIVEDVAEWLPGDLEPPTGVRLEVRPYGGYVLRHGNDDDRPQYGEDPPGTPTTKPRYIRELKHDLLYMAYYGDRERQAAKEIGGSSTFECQLVGSLLALKFDLSFFFGVPTTTDLAAATLSDAQFAAVTLESFDGPIYFDKTSIGDNPIKPIYYDLLHPIASGLGKIGVAQQQIGDALALYQQAVDPDQTEKLRKDLRKKAIQAFRAAKNNMSKDGPKAITLPDPSTITAVRKSRSIDDVVDHPVFAQAKRKPWETFEAELRGIAALHPLASGSHASAMQAVLDHEGKGTLFDEVQGALTRYRKYELAAKAVDAATLAEVRQIIGGLPETFEPYQKAMRAQAVVDHGTAIYIKAIMAGVKIGSSAGKVHHAGRKLVYRAAEGGITGEPDNLDDYADKVIEACKKGGKFDTPPFIMLERQKNESGFRATSNVGDLALTKDEKSFKVPQTGIDWSNWGVGGDGKVTKFFYSELFTHSVDRPQEHPGYFGPVVHSRGVGGGQVTLGTLVKGVSPKTRASKSDGFEWVAGIPVSADNATYALPPHWTGADGSIERARGLFRKKFTDNSKKRDCTFGNVTGGTRYDCSSCLARFDLGSEKDIKANRSGKKKKTIGSFRCAVDASRWKDLFGEELTDDSEAGRTEFPCSWLRAVQKYAGGGEKSYNRILKTSRELVALADETVEDKNKAKRALRAAIARARKSL